MSSDPFYQRFPEMRPVGSPPSLSSVNGIGFNIYGARDYDAESGTYVKTRFFTIVFIPFLALGAYRVADAPGGGWYFLGRVPLSGLAKAWNYLLAGGGALAIALAVWFNYTSSPDYAARQKIAEADRLADAGQLGDAANIYAKVIAGKTASYAVAANKLNDLMDKAPGAPPAQAAALFQAAARVESRSPNTLPKLVEAAVKWADANEKSPKECLAVLDAVASVPGARDFVERRAGLLEGLLKAEPHKIDYVSRLAVLYERGKDLKRCEVLLAPHGKNLGETEGARILGQIRAGQGKLDEAIALLEAYALPRLEREAGQDDGARRQVKAAEDRIVAELQQGKAPGFDYARHKQAPRAEQDRMINDYINARLMADEAGQAAMRSLLREQVAASAGFDLGVLLLRSAERFEGDKRKAELERAEKAFLATRGSGGGNEVVDLKLGEVYFWLGRQEEGRKLFDRVLAGRDRAPEALVMVAQVLRGVGDVTAARQMSEEAYNKAADPKTKANAAGLRSVMALDLDDRITWLGRDDTSSPFVKADLAHVRGAKALNDGNEPEAAAHFREAIALYSALPKDFATLNNGALVCEHLYRVTGAPEDFGRAVAMLEQALTLRPNDSIVVHNAAAAAQKTALREVLGEVLDLRALRAEGSGNLLTFLYSDAAGRDRVAARLRERPAAAKAAELFERQILLAPRNPRGARSLMEQHALTHDRAALKRLLERLAKADFDMQKGSDKVLETYQGKDVDKRRGELETGVARQRKTLEAARKVGGATHAVAACELAGGVIALHIYGAKADLDEAVRLAEEADKAAASRGTRTTLTMALLARGGARLAAKEKTYARWVARSRYALNESELLALALANESLRKAALADADLGRALELYRQEVRGYPESARPLMWALLRHSHPEDAAEVAKKAAADETAKVTAVLSGRLSTVSAGETMTEYWRQMMTGNPEQARAAWRRGAEQGIPMPFEMK